MDFDVEKFISEIESRRAIWDMNSPVYNDRYMKLKQWEEIVVMHLQPGSSNKDKREIRRTLQNKWKNLRDNFMKECRKKNVKISSEGGLSCKSQYRYYKHLSFLKPYAGKMKSRNFLVHDDDNDSDKGSNEEEGTSEKEDKGRRKRKKSETEDESQDIKVGRYEEDPDRQFMLSLVPDLKRVPDELKPIVKINIMKCILKTTPNSIKYM